MMETWFGKLKLKPPAGRRGLCMSDGVIFVPTREGVAAISEKNSGKILKNFGNQRVILDLTYHWCHQLF